MKKSELRGFSIFEHGCFLKYDIILDDKNKYYETFKNSDVEGTISHFETDSNGFIEPSKIHTVADWDIVFMGDSTVECSFVQPEKRFPYLVGRKIEQAMEQKVNSYNAGVSSADTLSLMKVLLMKIFPMEPNMVVLCNTDRELVYLLSQNKQDAHHMKGAENGKKKIIAYRDWVVQASLKRRVLICLQLIFGRKKLEQALSYKEETSKVSSSSLNDMENVLEVFEKDLLAFISLLQTRNIPLVLMTQANQYGKKDGDRLRKLYDINIYPITNTKYEEYCKLIIKANELIRQIGDLRGISVIDLERFAENKELLYDQVHYTNEGAVIVSNYISEQIKKILANHSKNTMSM